MASNVVMIMAYLTTKTTTIYINPSRMKIPMVMQMNLKIR